MVTKHVRMTDALLRHQSLTTNNTPFISLFTLPFMQWLFEGIRAGHFSSIITPLPCWQA